MRNTLNTSICFLILGYSFIAACKKSEGIPPIDTLSIRVLEYKTGQPISGVEVSVNECRSDWMSVLCTEISSGKTNQQGDYNFRNAYFNSILVSHPKYWHTGSYGQGLVLQMIPEAWQKVILKINDTYPPDAKLSLETGTNEPISDPFAPYFGFSFLAFGISFSDYLFSDVLPTDTTVYLRSLGNCQNYISWTVHTSAGAILKTGVTIPQVINPFDTTTVNIVY